MRVKQETNGKPMLLIRLILTNEMKEISSGFEDGEQKRWNVIPREVGERDHK